MLNMNQGFRPNRTYLQSGAMAAASLGDLQGAPKRKPARHLCRKHTWKQSRWTRTCTRCGVTEDKV